jgi:hypothetical protein
LKRTPTADGLAILEPSAKNPQTWLMDKTFIEKNQIIERYLTGKLPFKGVQDFERFCRENPEVLEDIRFADAVHKGVRLLEASGRTADFQEPKQPWWLHPWLTLGVAAASLLLAIGVWVLLAQSADLKEEIAALETQLAQGPLRPPGTTRTVRVTPQRAGPSDRADVTLRAGQAAEWIELRIDVSFARQNAFRLTIDKKDQAHAGVIHNLLRDSNGQLRLTLNSSGLHPGSYRVAIDGVTMRGARVPVAWFTVRVTD